MPNDDAIFSDSTRVLDLRATLPRADRPDEFADDLCFTPEMVAAFVNAYSDPGDVVFDPFAGFGTTLATAQRLGRVAVGLEINADRVAYTKTRLVDPSAIRER